jgi:hypothetical protein
MCRAGRLRRVAAACIALAVGACRSAPPTELRPADFGVDCTGSRDTTAALKTFLETVAAGRTARFPSGCRPLVASPGAGGAALVLASGTTIRCDDHSAGFFLARRACSGGRYQGAACTADADCSYCGHDCEDARCAADAGGDSQPDAVFAPRAGETYTLLASAKGAADVRVEGCAFFTNQVDRFARCSAVPSRPCAQVCDDAANLPGQACETTDCSAGTPGTCTAFGGYGSRCVGGTQDGQRCCKDAGHPSGTCLAATDCSDGTATSPTCTLASGAPSGPGRIAVVDFATATRAVVSDVVVYDLTMSPAVVRVGPFGQVRDADLGLHACPGIATSGPLAGWCHALYAAGPVIAIDNGIVATGGGAIIRHASMLSKTGVVAMGGRTDARDVIDAVTVPVAPGSHSLNEPNGQQPLASDDGIIASGVALVTNSSVRVASGTGIRVGDGSQVRSNSVTATAGNGIVTAQGATVAFNEVTVDTGRGIDIGASSTVLANRVNARRGTDRNLCGVGIYVDGRQVAVEANLVSACYAVYEDVAEGSLDETIQNNRLLGGQGAKVTIFGAGTRLDGNNMYWGSGATGLCAKGPNAGLPCDVARAALDCPQDDGGGCTRDPVIAIGSTAALAAGTSHVTIGPNLIHTNVPTALIRVADVGKRCTATKRRENLSRTCNGNAVANCAAGGVCSAGRVHVCLGGLDAGKECCDSAGGAGQCVAQEHVLLDVTGAELLGSGTYGIDLTTLTSGDTTLRSSKISGVKFLGEMLSIADIGFPVPRSPEQIVGLRVLGNDFGNTAPRGGYLSGWDWRFGSISGNVPLLPTDDAPQVAWLKNDDGLARQGDCVEIGANTDNAFTRCTAGSAVPAGVLLDAPAAGAAGQVMVQGTAFCNTDGRKIARGDALAPSGVPGRLGPVDRTARNAFAVALTANAGSELARCPSGGQSVPCVRCLLTAGRGRR